MASPRPILKRASSTSSSSTCSSMKSTVSFSSNISTTYLTHASTTYNRSPIQVDFNQCALPRGRSPGREYSGDDCSQWAVDMDGYESVMVREDEDSAEYYDSLTPLPPPCQTASVYAPSPSAYTSYRTGPSGNLPPRYTGSAKATLPSHHYSPAAFSPSPKRKLSDASDNSDTWSCLDGF
ncbi:hypothetical protein FRB99_005371 [Tulasnella sp. 403]|nr:hypothetical protein FRB99_005371 [Tulasnella sp. 403]